MKKYIACLKDQKDKHHLCRDLSKEYLQCRMDRQLMASEDLDQVSSLVVFVCCIVVIFVC